jgi:hypothetical protein
VNDEKNEPALTIRAPVGVTTTNEFEVWSATFGTAPPQDWKLPEVTDPKLIVLKYEFQMYFLMRSMPSEQGPLRNAFTESCWAICFSIRCPAAILSLIIEFRKNGGKAISIYTQVEPLAVNL